MRLFWALFALLALGGILGAGFLDGDRQLKVSGGRTTLSLSAEGLAAVGLSLSLNTSAQAEEGGSAFSIGASDFKFALSHGRFNRFDGGAIVHKGGFRISNGRNAIDANGFRVTAVGADASEGLRLEVGKARASFAAFELITPRVLYVGEEGRLLIGQMDVAISLDGARQLGRPDLAGQRIGTLSISGEATPIDGKGKVETPPLELPEGGDAPIDVKISALNSLVHVNGSRVGAYPNGRVGLSMLTTSCNVGTSNIPWRAPMQVDHPVIAMNLYRVKDGRFEQVGWSWLKHGFLATNSPTCNANPCQHPGTGSLLGPNCTDTYGTGNNADRTYLGGRDEVNPFTGVWTCRKSWFSNYVDDCSRRNPGIDPIDVVDHRLDVLDQDLGNTGATYIYEAYYINANDFDKYNNIASRTATATWTGASWSFSSDTGALINGPAINRWGEMRSIAEPRSEGDVIVAVQTTNLGGGMWHYEYSVYNHDLDRQVRTFTLPILQGATVQNIGFRDIDRDPTNQWTASVANGNITWMTGEAGSQGANPLKYSSVFNFRFDANVPPVNGFAGMAMFKAGSNMHLTASTKVPKSTTQASEFSMFRGSVLSGGLYHPMFSDDERLRLRPGLVLNSSEAPIQVDLLGVSHTTTPTSLRFLLEASADVAALTQSIQLFDYQANAFVNVDSRAVSLSDTLVDIGVANPARFVQPGTGTIRARLSWKQSGPVPIFPFTVSVDQAVWQIE